MKLIKQIKIFKNEIEKLKSTYENRLDEIEKNLIDLTTESNVFSDNWVGNWFENPEIYKDVIENSQLNLKIEYASLFKYITEKTSIDYKSLDIELTKIKKEVKNFNENLLVELSILKSYEQFGEQVKILDKLEDYEWGFNAMKIIDAQKPKKFIGSYSAGQRFLAKGMETPPHIAFSANLLSSGSLILALRDNLKISFRLLREIELLIDIDNDEILDDINPIVNLNKIFDNFHEVARLLVNRHAKRETIVINDEYDVQDLLRSLLKIFFDDVRPEDFTPSYAGRNTRIDFLLKKENIVIEVKKTRETLKDKNIGDELLQDIARYRNHPDCKILYCFVYDPQGYISNPRGLENDLSSESNDKMTVYVSIKP